MSEHVNEQHEHHNHRESFDIPDAEVYVEAHMHDQAATVSMAICPAEGKTYAFETLVKAMREIAAQAESIGGIVGHIKAFAREGNVFAHASVTAADIEPVFEGDTAASFGEEADIQMVCIVLLVAQDDLIAICRKALGA